MNNKVPFHIAFEIDTLNTFQFLNPLDATDVLKGEQSTVNIQWETHAADTSAVGELSYFTSGSGWELISTATKLSDGNWLWSLPDITEVAVLRMTTPFGLFYTDSFLIESVARPDISFNCADSATIYWNANSHAAGYNIFKLTSGPYLQPVLTTTDTFLVVHGDTAKGVFAIQPITGNRLVSARSQSVELTTGSPQCFYESIYYQLLDNNQLKLVLSVTGEENIRNIIFQEVSAGGVSVRQLSAVSASIGKREYTTLVSDLPGGTSYFVALMELNNGEKIFTQTIAVINSGADFIRFFPVPLRRNAPIQFVLKQGISPESVLCFYDYTGRMLKKYQLYTGDLQLYNLPRGILLYKLVHPNGRVVQSGKLVVE